MCLIKNVLCVMSVGITKRSTNKRHILRHIENVQKRLTDILGTETYTKHNNLITKFHFSGVRKERRGKVGPHGLPYSVTVMHW